MARITLLSIFVSLAIVPVITASVLQADLLDVNSNVQRAVSQYRAEIAVRSVVKRQGVVTPDGSCGGINGYTCTGSQGGAQPCCSASGFCGAGPTYCDAGCQSAFGTCGTPSAPAAPSHQTVLVGANGLTFTPDTITASPGSRISFQFSPGHHSVTQSSFSDPCHPLSSSSIFSGFVDDTSQIWTIPVVDTNPIYLYCSAPFHCQIGMVLVVNPPATGGTVNAYRSAAGGASASTNPSQVQGGTFSAFSVSPDGSCGGVNSYTCTGSQGGIQPCCSASGFCGAGPTYCGSGCQSMFGTCDSSQASSSSLSDAPSSAFSLSLAASSSLAPAISSSSSVSSSSSSAAPSPSTSGGVTPDGTCGGVNGYTCAGSQGGIQPCCSSSGFCGNGPLYCGVGCQSTFGSCGIISSSSVVPTSASSINTQPSAASSSRTSSPTSVSGGGVTPDGSCGPGSLGGYICTGIPGVYLPCCSIYGYCGDGPSYCGEGCQSGYGICYSDPSSSLSGLMSGSSSATSTGAWMSNTLSNTQVGGLTSVVSSTTGTRSISVVDETSTSACYPKLRRKVVRVV